VGGQIFVATEANLPYLQGYVEKGEAAELNPGKDNVTGRAWMWVNAPKGGTPKVEQVHAPEPTSFAEAMNSTPEPAPVWVVDIMTKLTSLEQAIKRIEDMAQ
jgi:hypothetical protein